MITPAAIRMQSFRAGNGDPFGIASGNVKTPARVIAPRTPANDTAAASLRLGTERACSPPVRPAGPARAIFGAASVRPHACASRACSSSRTLFAECLPGLPGVFPDLDGCVAQAWSADAAVTGQDELEHSEAEQPERCDAFLPNLGRSPERPLLAVK